jgi:hypothetical protein
MPDSGDLQFERAEYSGGGSGPVCCTCKQPAIPQHFQFRGRVYCAPCQQQIEHSIANLHQSGDMGRAALFGLGAAVLGSAIYYGVVAITHYELGLIAVLVGYLVGKAVRKGSGSAGGLQYQLLAVGLTYLSIASTYTLQVMGSDGLHGSKMGLLFFTVAAPFLGGFQNILGLVIIGIALWQAWKMNQRVDVKFAGPFGSAPRLNDAAP